jgi:hypothetical protein
MYPRLQVYMPGASAGDKLSNAFHGEFESRSGNFRKNPPRPSVPEKAASTPREIVESTGKYSEMQPKRVADHPRYLDTPPNAVYTT